MTTEYVLDVADGLPEVIVATTGGASTRYVQIQGQILARQESGAWAYVLPDHLGSVRQLTNAGGQVTLAQSYDPFGVLLESAGSGASENGYTGEQVDSSTGLVFLRARYYDPSVGRFISKDPWMGSPVQPQTQNGWGYVRNNPANRVDPSGKVDWDACTINGATGVCFAEPGDYLYKIAREIAAEISVAPNEQSVNALVGEILHLNPQLQARPNLIYAGEEIRLNAEWIMAMRPSQPTPAPPPPPPPPPPPAHLPTVLKGGCPSSSEVAFEPLRIELRYPGTPALPIELILFPPDMPPMIEANRDENMARLFGSLSLAADWVELGTIPLNFTPFGGLPDWIAVGDIVIAGLGSYSLGETYLLERPHPSLPPMMVLGQDVLVTSADAGIATLSRVILPTLGMEIGGAASGVGGIAGGIVGYIAGQAVDVGTTLYSIGYDRGRLEGTTPTYLSYAIFWEDRLRQAILIYGRK